MDLQTIYTMLSEIRVKQDRQGEQIAAVQAVASRLDERTTNMKDSTARSQGLWSLIIAAAAFLWSILPHAR